MSNSSFQEKREFTAHSTIHSLCDDQSSIFSSQVFHFLCFIKYIILFCEYSVNYQNKLEYKIRPIFGTYPIRNFLRKEREMSYIDRTEEFKLATNVHLHDALQPSSPLPPPSFSVSKFSKVTASLSGKVSKTTLKLQRLTERVFHVQCVILSGSKEKFV